MAGGEPEVTLNTLHGDLADLKGEMRAGFADLKGEMREGFADLKTTMIKGFAGLPTRESSEEMIRLLRENNRIQESRLVEIRDDLKLIDARTARADARSAELNVQSQERHARLEASLASLAESQRGLVAEGEQLRTEMRALMRLIESIIRGRHNGDPPV